MPHAGPAILRRLESWLESHGISRDLPAGAGTVAVLPKRLRHAYVVTSPTARFLTLHIPAGFEQFAAEVGEPAQSLTLPPQSTGLSDRSALAQAAARHGITIVCSSYEGSI